MRAIAMLALAAAILAAALAAWLAWPRAPGGEAPKLAAAVQRVAPAPEANASLPPPEREELPRAPLAAARRPVERARDVATELGRPDGTFEIEGLYRDTLGFVVTLPGYWPVSLSDVPMGGPPVEIVLRSRQGR